MYFSTYFYHVVSECKLRAESCDLCHFLSIFYRAVESDLHCCTLLPRHIYVAAMVMNQTKIIVVVLLTLLHRLQQPVQVLKVVKSLHLIKTKYALWYLK